MKALHTYSGIASIMTHTTARGSLATTRYVKAANFNGLCICRQQVPSRTLCSSRSVANTLVSRSISELYGPTQKSQRWADLHHRDFSTTSSTSNIELKKPKKKKRIIVAMTGATGAPLTVHLLRTLTANPAIETHLILSTWAVATLKHELSPPHNSAAYLHSLADVVYSPRDVSAPPSSGSFRIDGMIIVPCSMKTLAAVRMGYDNDLITRAAGVTLKERRRLVLVARETPLSMVQCENMLEVTKAGAVVFPPVMAFYTKPSGVQHMVAQSVRRMIDALGLDSDEDDGFEWSGFGGQSAADK